MTPPRPPPSLEAEPTRDEPAAPGRDAGAFPDFSSFFRAELLPGLEAFERVRKIRLRAMAALSAAAVIVSLALLVSGAGGGRAPVLPAAVLLAGAVAMAILDATLFKTARRRSEFSRRVVARTVEAAVPGMAHAPARSVGGEDFRDSLLYGREPLVLSGRDLFIGRREGYLFVFSWLKADHGRKSEAGGLERNLFAGWFFMAEFPRRFRGETLILPDLAGAAMGWFGRSPRGSVLPAGMEAVRLEDPDFERAFRTFSTGQIDARCILTPALMRDIVHVGARAGGRLSLAFRGNRLYAGTPAWAEYFGLIRSRSFTDPAFTRHLFQAARGVDGLAASVARTQKVWQDENSGNQERDLGT